MDCFESFHAQILGPVPPCGIDSHRICKCIPNEEFYDYSIYTSTSTSYTPIPSTTVTLSLRQDGAEGASVRVTAKYNPPESPKDDKIWIDVSITNLMPKPILNGTIELSARLELVTVQVGTFRFGRMDPGQYHQLRELVEGKGLWLPARAPFPISLAKVDLFYEDVLTHLPVEFTVTATRTLTRTSRYTNESVVVGRLSNEEMQMIPIVLGLFAAAGLICWKKGAFHKARALLIKFSSRLSRYSAERPNC